MSLVTLLILLGLGFLVVILILFPESRVLLKGFTRLFIKDVAATPEGASAVYDEKIRQAQDTYNKTSNSLMQIKGRFENCKTELGELQSKLQRVEKECEKLASRGERELLIVKAEERESIIERIASVDDMVDKYETAFKEAELVNGFAEKKLRSLRSEKTETVQRMEDNQNLKKLYDDLDELKNIDGVDTLLEAVKEKDKKLSEEATGAKYLHQNKLETKLGVAEKHAHRIETNDYVDSLLAKYDTRKAIPVNNKK